MLENPSGQSATKSIKDNNIKRYVTFSVKRNSYITYYNKKTFYYSVNRYGNIYARKLAEMSFENGKKYKDYFEINNEIVTFFIYTKAYNIVKVLIDKNDLNKILPYKISIAKDNHAKTFYAKTKIGSLHRIIMNVYESKDFIDHINRNGLDNRKSNLRIVNCSINNRNANLRKDNISGIKGVCEDKQRFRVFWYEEKREKKSKSFSKNKYGYENAKEMAYLFRKHMEKLNNYL